MSCDHFLGYLYEYNYNKNLYASEYIEQLRYVSKSSTHSVYKLLDQRRGYSRLFKYCPDCGKKLNWEKLKQALKEEKI